MSTKRRNSDLNNLSSSLHSIISGDAVIEGVNIPFADDDDEATLISKTNGKSSDSISSNESYTDRVNFNTGRRAPMKQVSYNTTGNEASGESDSDSGHLASEKRDKAGPLASEMARMETSSLGVMRRNSISMPVLNEMDLDALRNLHMQAIESSDTMDDSQESLTKITVSEPFFNEALRRHS